MRMLPRGRYALLASGIAREGRFVATLAADLGACRFDCDLGDDLAREACLTGYYEPPVTRIVRAQLSGGGVFVDAGANWGYFTLVGAHAVGPRGKVIALEPDPRQFAALQANVALNGFTTVLPVRAAAAGARGRLMLAGYQEAAGNRGVSRLDGGTDAGPRFEVDALAIDEATSAYASVDLVKIDVEGAEDLVLAGMQAGLAARRYRAIVLELHPGLLRARGIDPASIPDRIRGYGYRLSTIDLSPAAYRRAAREGASVESLLKSAGDWRGSDWPHILCVC